MDFKVRGFLSQNQINILKIRMKIYIYNLTKSYGSNVMRFIQAASINGVRKRVTLIDKQI